MKRILVSIFMLLLLFLHIPSVSAKSLDFDGDYSFYTKSFYKDENCTTIQNGNIYIISCKASYADILKSKLVDIIGESVTMPYDCTDIVQFAKNVGDVYFCQMLEGICVAEGFSQNFTGGVLKQNKKINFQIAYDGERMTIGTPMILGGF